MKVVIIEDEAAAVQNLQHFLKVLEPNLTIVEIIDSVLDAVDFFQNGSHYDLVFMDIHLADGNSFELFKTVEPKAPIIFTTAYDQYAVQAFKVNSIDYLLKPIQEVELKNAIEKFKTLQVNADFSNTHIQNLIGLLQTKPKKFRQSYLVQKGETLVPVAAQDFAFFFIQNGIVRGITKENMTYHLDGKLEDLEKELDPADFFRTNRQYLVQRSAIKNLNLYFNGRLLVNTTPEAATPIIVSKANARKLKDWLNQA